MFPSVRFMDSEGLHQSQMEMIRCLKRFVAREIFNYLCGAQRSVPSISKAT